MFNWHKKEKPFLGYSGFGGASSGLAFAGSSINTKGSGGVVELADNGMVTHIFVTPGVDASAGEGGAFDPDTSQTFVADENIPGVLFFVIGGGGGGGYAGGGGAGGAVTNAITGNTITVPAGTYPVTIGGGGHSNWSAGHAGNYGTPSFPAPQPFPVSKANDGPRDGQNSVWNGYTGMGGGCGGVEFGPGGYSSNPSGPHGNAGGCGGGGAQYGGNGPAAGGDNRQTSLHGPAVPQGPNGTNYGHDGGNGNGGNYFGGGGGGIGQNGSHAPTASGNGTGGDGLMIPICPPNYGTTGPSAGRWLGGGGGSSNYPSTSYAGGAGGGNDGNILFPDTSKSLGWTSPSDIPSNFHTGGGGGGGANHNGRQPTRGNPGIVIIAYPNG